MPFAQLRDLAFYYELKGVGPRVLFISGTGGDLRRPPTAFDWPLAAHFTELAYDQRGLGQSARPDTLYSMADFAADADGLMTALGWATCSVVGVSFGGMVAQEFALRYPGRVERLVLCCASSGGVGGAAYPLHELSDLSPQAYAAHTLGLFDTRRDTAWQTASPAKSAGALADTMAAITFAAGEPGRAIGARRQLDARRRHDAYARLPSLKVPTLICGGRYDGISPPANLEALCRQIPGARLAMFEGGHRFYFQDPAAFACILAFLGER